MSEHLGIRFKIGEAFRASDPLARWMTICAMALNDLLLVNRWLVPRLKEEIESQPYENVYLARVSGGHLYEVAKFLANSDRQVPEVGAFIESLSESTQEAYGKVKSLGKDGSSDFADQLKRARNQFFHYSELLPQAEDHEAIKAAMEAHGETLGEIRDGGAPIDHFRASFADDITVELSFPDEEVDLPEFLREVSESIAVFFGFAFEALPGYVRSLPDGAWEFINEE